MIRTSHRVLLMIILILVLSSCGAGSQTRTAKVTPAPTLTPTAATIAPATGVSPVAGVANGPTDSLPSFGTCPVTPYSSSGPPEANAAAYTPTWYGNAALWAGRGGQWQTGGIKVLWYRSVSGPLTIEGRRLDGVASPLRAEISPDYGSSGIQPSGLYFPTPGCWEVIGRVMKAELRFVVSVPW